LRTLSEFLPTITMLPRALPWAGIRKRLSALYPVKRSMIRRAFRFATETFARRDPVEGNPPTVSLVQWVLVLVPIGVALLSYEIRSYALLASLTQVLVGLNVLLLIVVTREVLTTRTIGKFCLVGSTFIFYWLDASALAGLRQPFGVAEGFPINATQFDQELIQQGLVYVSVFQLLLFVGFSIRPRLERPLRFFVSRVDSLSFDRTLIAMAFVLCSIIPLLIYYDFDDGKIFMALMASRSGTERLATDRSTWCNSRTARCTNAASHTGL